MSEQAEIAHATDIMRSRFLSGSQRIASHLSWIDEHAEELSADVRAYLTSAASKVAAAQERLLAQLDRLPLPQWERFKAMLTLLRAQQDVLDSAETLMQRARANAVSRNTGPTEGPARRETAPASAGSAAEEERAKWQIMSVIPGATSLRLVVLVVLGAGLACAYATFPRESGRQKIAAKPAAWSTGDVSVAPQPAPEPPPAPARFASGAADVAPAAAATGARTTIDTGAVGATPTSPPPSDTQPIPLPKTLASGGGATSQPAAGGSSGFVPVVFTDKDKARALRAFSELQMRYPRLLSQRRAEAQPVDLGAKGVWNRLVVLPPGSRQSATAFCDQLLAAGYDRCWVKSY